RSGNRRRPVELTQHDCPVDQIVIALRSQAAVAALFHQRTTQFPAGRGLDAESNRHISEAGHTAEGEVSLYQCDLVANETLVEASIICRQIDIVLDRKPPGPSLHRFIGIGASLFEGDRPVRVADLQIEYELADRPECVRTRRPGWKAECKRSLF